MQARALVLASLALASCALDDALPPSPAEATARDEAALEARLTRTLDGLPGLRAARAVVALPVRDPLGPAPTAHARVAIALVADGDRDGLRVAAERAARALLGPDAAIDVAIIAAPPTADRRRQRLAAGLGAIAIATGAGAMALGLARRRARYRGTRPQ